MVLFVSPEMATTLSFNQTAGRALKRPSSARSARPHLDLITQASLIGVGLLSLFLRKLGKRAITSGARTSDYSKRPPANWAASSRWLQLDRFEEDFNISRVRLKPQPGSKIRLSSQRLNPKSTINNAPDSQRTQVLSPAPAPRRLRLRGGCVSGVRRA
jgi:hypothetical protein